MKDRKEFLIYASLVLAGTYGTVKISEHIAEGKEDTTMSVNVDDSYEYPEERAKITLGCPVEEDYVLNGSKCYLSDDARVSVKATKNIDIYYACPAGYELEENIDGQSICIKR